MCVCYEDFAFAVFDDESCGTVSECIINWNWNGADVVAAELGDLPGSAVLTEDANGVAFGDTERFEAGGEVKTFLTKSREFEPLVATA